MTNDAEALQRGQSESGCRCLAPVSTPMKDGLTLVERYFVGELKSHFGESRTSGRSFRTSGRSFRAFWGQRGWLGHFEDSLGRETTQASNQLLSLSHCTRRRRRRLNRGRIHGILGGMGEDLYLGRHIHERCHPSRRPPCLFPATCGGGRALCSFLLLWPRRSIWHGHPSALLAQGCTALPS
jgi:hypothetical protein